MKKRMSILWVVGLVAAVAMPTFGAIVYSGSQNVILSVNPMSPMDSKTIELGGMAGEWDDFRVELWLDMAMMGMPGAHPPDPTVNGMAMGARLAIYAPGSMGSDMGMAMDMGGILGLRGLASKLAMGAAIGADSFFDVWVEVSVPDAGEAGADGGYIGLRTGMGQYGWLHIRSRSPNDVVFDGWAYEDRPGIPLATGQGAVCDWVPGRPFKMHWPQLPDLGFTGIDISLAQTALGDDFKCTATGPIRDIHFWGSFRDDILPKDGPESLTLEVSIYSDIPATTVKSSRPGNLLWKRLFKPGEYSARRVHEGVEDWYDPATGLYLPGNHKAAYQYNFCIDEDPFTQQQGTIYWLVVRDLGVSSTGDYQFGWKTASPRYRWNDDAVFVPSTASSVNWWEMTYPKGHSHEGQSLDLAFVITGDDEAKPEYDLGDAPDSSNSVAGATMLAYPSGVLAHFPTVYQAGSPPYGPIHRHPRDMFFLGKAVSLETEADLGPDEDIVNNLDPLNNAANRDAADDGLRRPAVLPLCGTTTLDYVVTVTDAAPPQAYVNVWCDWNRDGDWDDILLCPDGSRVTEWAVQNDKPVLPGVGTYTFTTSPFKCWHPVGATIDPLWVRITIGEQEHFPSILIPGAAPGIEGAGPKDGYQYGETEDYYVRPRTEPAPVKYDWGDAPSTAAAVGYPTLAAENGARHVPVGPWLGDSDNMPDSEPDGQPDPDALGDDNNGNPDENGVEIASPLTQGQVASATIEVNGGGGVVQAWIDLNGDHTWQNSEKIFDGFRPDGIHVIPFVVPTSAATGETFARFRISTRGGLGPAGEAQDGEVEDHALWIEKALPEAKRWCQPPDLTPRGIDIRLDGAANRPMALADDFQCKIPGRLTHIRLWGSWKHDRKGEIKKIRVRIHPDDPVGPEGLDKRNLFSKPRPEILWEREFLAGEFEEMLYYAMAIGREWWWDPAPGEVTPDGDSQVWQIDLDIPSAEAFLQEGTQDNPRIYWLAVEVEAADGQFGWKTRQWPDHFMDDAVWDSSPTLPRTWHELRYPPGHPYYDKERNSIDLAFCLLFETAAPPPATMQPVAMTTCPPTETTCPALRTTCPIMETQCPAEPTKCPEALTQCPPTPTQCQAVDTECPALETECPPLDTKCPVASTKCPEYLTRCPPTPTQCHAVDTECPALETHCPPLQTKCPVASTKCPEYLTRCPPTPTECHAVDTECPALETHCPPLQTKCPVMFTECPESLTRCPPTETQCQVAETQCPIVETECPPLQTKCPSYPTRCPESLTKCPPTATECHAVQTECPVLSTECPASLTKCPPTPTKCQVVDTECPAQETRCPPLETECPPLATWCPAEQTKCPPVDTECPPARTACPVIATTCPAEETKCPPAETKCPPERTVCPVVSTECPGGFTYCPPTETRCPLVETKCPVERTYCPVEPTVCPGGPTYCPPVKTQCPPELTECPPTDTLCQGVITQCAICVSNEAQTGTVAGAGSLRLDSRCPIVETDCPTVAELLAVAAAR